MATFTLRVDMDNAAFADGRINGPDELGRILREMADLSARGVMRSGEHPLHDVNGNVCGRWGYFP